MPNNDPRKKRRFDSVNEEILDRSIRHGAFLVLHASYVSRQALEFLQREVFPDILGKLVPRLERIRRRGGRMDWTTKRRLEMVRAVNAQVRTGAFLLRDRVADDLKQLALRETRWMNLMLRQVTPIGFDFVSPAPRLVEAAVTQNPIQGRLLREWFQDVERDTARRVLQQVRLGVVAGDTNERIIRRVRGTARHGFRDGVWQATRNQVETVVRTSVMHIGNEAQRLTHEANRDVVTKVKWVATLDGRVCVACLGLDGTTWPVGEAEYPPLHPRCRCVISTVLDGWEEFGLDPDDIPVGTRASMNGQVPADISIQDWLRGQSSGIQDQILGKTKARLWREGKVQVRSMSDANGRILNLEDLARAEGLTEADFR